MPDASCPTKIGTRKGRTQHFLSVVESCHHVNKKSTFVSLLRPRAHFRAPPSHPKIKNLPAISLRKTPSANFCCAKRSRRAHRRPFYGRAYFHASPTADQATNRPAPALHSIPARPNLPKPAKTCHDSAGAKQTQVRQPSWRGVANERVARSRFSSPDRPRVMRCRPRGRQRSVDRGKRRPAIQPRKGCSPGRRRTFGCAEGHIVRLAQCERRRVRRGRRTPACVQTPPEDAPRIGVLLSSAPPPGAGGEKLG